LRPCLDAEVAVLRERLLVLADLIVLRHVGVVVVLAREAIVGVDRAVDGQRRLDTELDRAPVDHGQGPRHALTDGTGLGVGRGAEGGGAAAEHLRAGAELRVHLEADDDLVGGVAPALLGAHRGVSSGGFRSCHEGATSYAFATRRMVASAKACPMIWRPMGNPIWAKPPGVARPGGPPRVPASVRVD